MKKQHGKTTRRGRTGLRLLLCAALAAVALTALADSGWEVGQEVHLTGDGNSYHASIWNVDLGTQQTYITGTGNATFLYNFQANYYYECYLYCYTEGAYVGTMTMGRSLDH